MACQHSEQQTTSEYPSPTGNRAEAPSPNFDMAQRYLELLGGGDAPHLFQTYNDHPDRNDPKTGCLHRRIYGRLSDVWPQLMRLQLKGAAIGVTIAETDGRGREKANMLRPRAVWNEADGPCPPELPLLPSITAETSPGKRHYVYMVRDLDWGSWHGIQRRLIDEFGSDPQAAAKTQVLRLPGTLHQKDPAKPHLVRIVEELSSNRAYTVAEIVAAIPPKFAPPPRRHRQPTASSGSGTKWEPEKIISAYAAIDARLQKNGPFTAQGDRPDDQAIEVDWSDRLWWLRGTAAIHHASCGSEEGFELSCRVSGGDGSAELVGCPDKFDAADQRRVWDSFSGGVGAPVTMATIYWIAQRYCGWNAGGRGRPMAQPREAPVITAKAQTVANAGRRAVSVGLDRVQQLHADICAPLFKGDALMGRILEEIRARINPSTGVAGIGRLASMANTLRCRPDTLRRRIRELAQSGLIIKNDGNAASMFSTSGGITIALALPESVWNALNPQQSTATPFPPISDTTGIATPHFQAQAGWNLIPVSLFPRSGG